MSNKTDSKYESINKTLGAIGKAVFVNFYYDFKDETLPDDVLAKRLYEENPNSVSSKQGFRIPRARHIFAAGQNLDALRIIVESDRVDPAARQKAKIILLDEERAGEKNKASVLFYHDLEQMNGKPVYVTGKDRYKFKAWYLVDCSNNSVVLYNISGTLNVSKEEHTFIVWSDEPLGSQIEEYLSSPN